MTPLASPAVSSLPSGSPITSPSPSSSSASSPPSAAPTGTVSLPTGIELVHWDEESVHVLQFTVPNPHVKANADGESSGASASGKGSTDEVIARRVDNAFVNGTKLLNLAGLTRGRRDSALKNVRERVVVLKGPRNLKGVWIPLHVATSLAHRFHLHGSVATLLEPQLVARSGLDPKNLPPTRAARIIKGPTSSLSGSSSGGVGSRRRTVPGELGLAGLTSYSASAAAMAGVGEGPKTAPLPLGPMLSSSLDLPHQFPHYPSHSLAYPTYRYPYLPHHTFNHPGSHTHVIGSGLASSGASSASSDPEQYDPTTAAAGSAPWWTCPAVPSGWPGHTAGFVTPPSAGWWPGSSATQGEPSSIASGWMTAPAYTSSFRYGSSYFNPQPHHYELSATPDHYPPQHPSSNASVVLPAQTQSPYVPSYPASTSLPAKSAAPPAAFTSSIAHPNWGLCVGESSMTHPPIAATDGEWSLSHGGLETADWWSSLEQKGSAGGEGIGQEEYKVEEVLNTSP